MELLEDIENILAITYNSVKKIVKDKCYIVETNSIQTIYSIDNYTKFNGLEVIGSFVFNNGDMCVIYTLSERRTEQIEKATQTIIIYSEIEVSMVLEGKFLHAYRVGNLDVFLGRLKGSMKSILLIINSTSGVIVCKQECLSVSVTKDNFIYFNTWNYGNGSELKYVLDSGEIISFNEYIDLQCK